MSAQEQMRRMLDELMGTRRNGEDSRQQKFHFTDPRVCKTFLLNCCPHEILTATRGDMGQCKRVHDVALRADYENSNKEHEYAFQREAMQHLKNFVSESEKKTQFAKVRLAEIQDVLTEEETARLQKIKEIEEEITAKLIEAEKLGELGEVEGSMTLMEEVEELKKRKFKAEEEHRNATPASISQQQKLRVCEVCTSYLGVHDNDRRLADHFNGKLHLGFITIREKLKELEELVADHHIKNAVSSEFERDVPFQRSRSRSPHVSKRHRRSRSRSNERRHSSHKSSRRDSHHSSHHRHRHGSHSKDWRR